jgi:hypothetical protein
MSPGKIIDIFHRAAELNRTDPLRNGQMINFPGGREDEPNELLVLGDLHNHTRNFEKFRKVAALDRFPRRHVLLQEIIHGGPLGQQGEDRSLDMLVQAMEWALHHPGQVHFLLANHDMAQVQRVAIMKDGYDLTDRFARYMNIKFGGDLNNANAAFNQFVYSMPLAAITATGIMFTHSLPAARDIANFDRTILQRNLTAADYARNGPIYQLIWGRSQTQEVLNTLSRAWWSEIFVCGHQSYDDGYAVVGDRMLIIDSCHNHGVFLHVDLARQYTLDDLKASLRPLAAIA